MNIHKLFAERRNELGMSQGQMATHLNVTQGQVSRWEKDSKPGIQHLFSICHLLGISIEEVDQALEENNND